MWSHRLFRSAVVSVTAPSITLLRSNGRTARQEDMAYAPLALALPETVWIHVLVNEFGYQRRGLWVELAWFQNLGFSVSNTR